MARTRSSALKGTGAPAPRKAIPAKAEVVGRQLATRPRKSAVKPATINNTQTNTLTTIVSGEEVGVGDFCIICHNGNSTVVICDVCAEGVCQACVRVENLDGPFKCPTCHGSGTPYPHDLVAKSGVRTLVKRLHLVKTVIISISLTGMEPFGDTGMGVYNSLYPYLRGNVVLFKLIFNFEDTDAVHRSVDELVELLESPPYAMVTQFLVVLTSHSDPTSGDLHTEPDCKGAAPMDQLVDILLPQKLRTILVRGGSAARNLFVLLACGSTATIPSAAAHLRMLGKTAIFHEVVAFTQDTFQYAFAHNFLNDALLSFFIYGRQSVTSVLRDHHVLGGHSGLVVFTSSNAYKYLWSHEVRQPFGQFVPKQCTSCKHVAGYDKRAVDQKKPRFDEELFLVCKACKKKVIFKFPSNGAWITGQAPVKNSRGDWLKVPI